MPRPRPRRLLKDMQDRILALASGYFGHADFAARFIRKKFAEQQELREVAAFRYQGRDAPDRPRPYPALSEKF